MKYIIALLLLIYLPSVYAIKSAEEYGLIRSMVICNAYFDTYKDSLFNPVLIEQHPEFNQNRMAMFSISIKWEVVNSVDPINVRSIIIEGPNKYEFELNTAIEFNTDNLNGYNSSTRGFWFLGFDKERELENGLYTITVRLENGHIQQTSKILNDKKSLLNAYKNHISTPFDNQPIGIYYSNDNKLNDPTFNWKTIPIKNAYYQLKVLEYSPDFSQFDQSINRDSIFYKTGRKNIGLNRDDQTLYSDLEINKPYIWYVQIFDAPITKDVNEIIMTKFNYFKVINK